MLWIGDLKCKASDCCCWVSSFGLVPLGRGVWDAGFSLCTPQRIQPVGKELPRRCPAHWQTSDTFFGTTETRAGLNMHQYDIQIYSICANEIQFSHRHMIIAWLSYDRPMIVAWSSRVSCVRVVMCVFVSQVAEQRPNRFLPAPPIERQGAKRMVLT